MMEHSNQMLRVDFKVLVMNKTIKEKGMINISFIPTLLNHPLKELSEYSITDLICDFEINFKHNSAIVGLNEEELKQLQCAIQEQVLRDFDMANGILKLKPVNLN